eukprot:m.33420 g.33420  ORF g.33420 m.33420 type:complete len:363 (+) comp12234_c0_seq3:138-1226(+)
MNQWRVLVEFSRRSLEVKMAVAVVTPVCVERCCSYFECNPVPYAKLKFFAVSKQFYSMTRMNDGITNVVLHCHRVDTTTPSPHPNDVLIRIYGPKTEMLIDRERELTHHNLLHEQGLAMPLYGSFSNGYAYGYATGTPCTPTTMAEPTRARQIAEHLGTMHAAVAPTSKKVTCFDLISNWIEMLPTSMPDEARQQVFATVVDPEELRELLGTLQTQAMAFKQDVVFCHNDLLAGNVIFDEAEGTVKFIDYEYSNSNAAAFDLANHFNEYCGLGPVNFSAYPSLDAQTDFVTAYLAERFQSTPDDDTIAELLKQIQLYRGVSHLYWGVWAIIQAAYSSIDFDYLDYFTQRLAELKRLQAEAAA